jgi:hypothetical protein
MKNCSCNNCDCHIEHPEGIQESIELLENLPKEMLFDFSEKASMYPTIPIHEIWEEVINHWYNSKKK